MATVVAPAGPCSRDELWRGLAWLRARYRIRLSHNLLEREGYLAGPDERRRSELQRAIADSDSKAIFAARGGYGAMRIAGDIAWDHFAREPKWLVGFSDITALHAMAWRAGVASIHGCNVTTLGREATPSTRASWLSSLERPDSPRIWAGLEVLRPGDASGVIVGGNLTVLHAMAAAGKLWLPPGAILALEDVAEAPYRIDRMMTSLRLGGHLAGVSALVLGHFERCAPGPDGRTAHDAIVDCTGSLRVPVLGGAPFGHGPRSEAFVIGVRAAVHGDEVRLGS
jgi:muramoyltetrapeptide carboxypeptidase